MHVCAIDESPRVLQIYGEDETVYGYRGLGIHVQMASGSLATRVHVTHKQKLKSKTTVDDVEGTLAKFLPAGYYGAGQEDEFAQRVEEDGAFVPPGRRIHGYKGKGKDREGAEYEVYHVSVSCGWECAAEAVGRPRWIPRDFGSTTDACSSSFCCTLRAGAISMTRKRAGSLLFCEPAYSVTLWAYFMAPS